MRLRRSVFLLVGVLSISTFSLADASRQAAQIVRNDAAHQRIYSDGFRAFQEIYDTPIPAQIRQTFDRTQVDKTCFANKSAFMVLDGEKPANIFTKKFIVVDVVPDGSSSISATLIFEGTFNSFSLRMDALGGGKYELRSMAELPGLLDEGLVRQLQSPAYRRYWL